MSVDLSSFAELMKSLGSSLGGTRHGRSRQPRGLEARGDPGRRHRLRPLPAAREAAARRARRGSRATPRTLSSADAGQLSQFGSFAGTDPRDVFGLLKAVSGSIEAVGTDEIRGVETSHYRATIDTAKLEQLVPAAQRQSLGGLDQSAEQAGSTEIPLDVWIDADQRVRKLSIDVDAEAAGHVGAR